MNNQRIARMNSQAQILVFPLASMGPLYKIYFCFIFGPDSNYVKISMNKNVMSLNCL